MRRLNPGIWLVAAQAIAFWPAWRGYGLRAIDRSGEPWAILALMTFAAYLAAKRRAPVSPAANALVLPAIVLVIQIFAVPNRASLMFQMLLAMLSFGLVVQGCWFGRRMHAGAWGLAALALPILPALDFYLGYPLRIVTGYISEMLLRMSGFMVTLDGTALAWNGRLIAVDAPCSGLRMMWAGFYLALTLACFTEQPLRRSAMMMAATLAAVIAGNALRASALFFSEAGLVKLPPWGHEAIGIVIFGGMAAAGVWLVLRKRRRVPGCAI
ncbi:exosortase/archaeosortase family protein [bacterium]|nr:exosortase/archaeosortase family protein [bacterium]